MTKRLCLFAGYSKLNIVEDYVVYSIKNIAELADVYYCADCEMPPRELEKLSPYTKSAISLRHKKYDFGSWQILFSQIKNISEYDEVILVNDSVYGPLFPLQTIFAEMEGKENSAWGICGNKFIMSFFVVLKKEIFLSDWFSKFINSVCHLFDKNDVVRLYEQKLSDLITENNFKWECLFSSKNLKSMIKKQKDIFKDAMKTYPFKISFFHHFRHNKVRVYDDDFFVLIALKIPFIKKTAFAFTSNHFSLLAPKFIKKYSDYPYHMIEKSLKLNNVDARFDAKKMLIKSIKEHIFEKKYKEYGIVYKLFKIKIFVKKHKI